MRCPVCGGGGSLVYDRERGMVICRQCGLVVSESAVDVGPKWRVFDKREKRKVKIEPRCVYGPDGKPLQDVYILLVYGYIVRVIVIVGKEFYVFLFESDAKEFIRRRFGLDQFEVRHCKSS